MEGIPRLTQLNTSNRFELPVSPSPYIKSPSTYRSPLAGGTSDILLADLSPANILGVLRSTDIASPINGPKERVLADSIAEASQHERALGIRVALASKRLKDFLAELQSWTWPQNGFQPPLHVASNIYWGSFPSSEVLEKEDRLEHMKDELNILEVEELKNHVRNVHLEPQSRRVSGSSQTSLGSLSYNRLTDFNVLITAMIVQALPVLATLLRLLGDWSLRLLVLKQIPGFLQQLEDTQLALESAWTSIAQATDLKGEFSLTIVSYQRIKEVLETRVIDLARRIDAILDALEGHDDSIPERWIDDMEEAETDYKNWVVEAERLVKLHEWQASKEEEEEAPTGQNHFKDQDRSNKSEANGINAEAHKGLQESNGTFPIASQPEEDLEPFHHTSSIQAQNSVGLDLKATRQSERSPSPAKHTSTRGLFLMQTPMTSQNESSAELSTNTKQASPAPPDMPTRHPGRKPAPLSLNTSQVLVDDAPKSHMSALTSASSSGFTDMSSPQIFDASEVQYFKSPMDDHFPITVTRDAEDIPSSKSTGFGAANRFKHGRSISAFEPMTRSRASSLQSQLTINGNENEEQITKSIEERMSADLSIEERIKEAGQEFYDAPSSPNAPDVSPSLKVRKARLPVEQIDVPISLFSLDKASNGHNSKQVEDKMTAKISRLLTKIPAPIKLAAHPQESESELDTDTGISNQPRQQRSVTPALTLSPVTSKTKSAQPNDSGVRVYHLYQPGKEVPIKLFIRLVGSEERVMVRVGGGWADLAEYLKEYAIHHGRRSASSNNLELKGLPSAQNTANSSFDASYSPAVSMSGSPNSKVGTPINRRHPLENPQTPETTRQTDITTPNYSDRFRFASALSTPDDQTSFVGLGGPKVKEAELSPHKKAWVDGMLQQARHLSSEHKKLEDIGDLGKVGNTKRVFLKGKIETDAQ